IRTLFATGQFDSVRVEQRGAEGRVILAIVVTERPVLRSWTVEGPDKISVRDVRDRVTLVAGRALDRAAMVSSAFAIDSMYRDAGYYGARVTTQLAPADSGAVTVTFNVREGSRVAISQ